MLRICGLYFGWELIIIQLNNLILQMHVINLICTLYFSLFPTMPRHNYHLVSDRVQALCKKHDLPYVSKPLLTAMTDILR